jgi:glycosidase
MLNLLGSHDAPRARTVCGGDIAAMRIATLLQMTLPGAPCIYYGDEVGLEGEQDPSNRGAFPWERDRWDNGLRAYIRDLVGLRKRHQALRDGELRVLATDGHAFAMLRSGDGESFVVATNAGESDARLRLTLPEGYGSTEGASVLTIGGIDAGTVHGAGGSLELQLPPRAGTVIRLAAQDVAGGRTA